MFPTALGGDSEELIRSVSKAVLADPAILAPVHEAVVGAADGRFASNPSIVEAIGEATKDNALHWMRSMYEQPRLWVVPNLSSQVVGIGREGFRWGAENTLRTAYRAGEQAMWSLWMKLAFSQCDDPEILLPALDHASRSLARWVEDTAGALVDLLERERTALSGDAQVRRLELVNQLLGGAAVPMDDLDEALSYPLSASHLSVIISAPPRLADRARLVQAASVVCRLTEAAHHLLVHASTSSLWLWTTPRVPMTPDDLETATAHHPDVRFVVGPLDVGVDGFRRSHHRALEAQRLVRDHGAQRIVFYEDVAVVLLLAAEGPRLREFVHTTLGPLASGPAELRDTLRVFIRERYNASQTARLLFTHRNTVLQRIRRAEQLLPTTLDRHGANVGLALDAMHWLNVPLD
ncbi:helix-turn-helix domain-containing protein [Streptomyces sp. Li-HN-5-11]|uniref:PucR family transcriptional regulator n=1 Tax=Streptomyces sp. Li-HN-5-11 TaxID=3075432 RepID=UPI0028AB7D27|nr:helix-turn-helix domain-containing protein [Streptomyces sp. Li-HN-5-11]WNM31951.1 helix-turn-helix domain-containing protein [Streptomyces sp. Li-HN-5-11]